MNSGLFIEGQQYFDEYVLIAPGSDYGRAMWSDIALLENGTILENALRPTNKVLATLHHIHFSFAINRKVKLPFQRIWKYMYSLEAIHFNPAKRYCVIYTDVSAARTDDKYLKYLSEKKNISLVLVMVNTMARRESLMNKRLQFFSIIFSFDKKDSEEYRFIYHPTNYSIVDMKKSSEIKTDAFYVGVSKGRAAVLADVYTSLSKSGASTAFYIAGVKKHEKKQEGIHYNKWLSYEDVLNHICESNCIVEIMDGKQEGVTLRTMEAICYNKKLLTNNLSMKQSKYYKSGNIQVFNNPSEIDISFIKDRSPTDYGYDGEFSPIHLLEHINQIQAEKK